jgi:hypothetical protein
MTGITHLQKYLQGVANKLHAEYEAAGAHANNSDKGSNREDTLLSFLQKHLPSRCQIVKGGTIFDALGNESRQIDLIVMHDITVQFRDQNKAFCIVEGAISAIAVKSVLTKEELFDSLDNLASIPLMPDLQRYISPLVANPDDIKYLPTGIVWAFDSKLSATKLTEHVEAYYRNNPQIPTYRQVRLVIVNNKVLIYRNGSKADISTTGRNIEPNQLIDIRSNNLGSYSCPSSEPFGHKGRKTNRHVGA